MTPVRFEGLAYRGDKRLAFYQAYRFGGSVEKTVFSKRKYLRMSTKGVIIKVRAGTHDWNVDVVFDGHYAHFILAISRSERKLSVVVDGGGHHLTLRRNVGEKEWRVKKHR